MLAQSEEMRALLRAHASGAACAAAVNCVRGSDGVCFPQAALCHSCLALNGRTGAVTRVHPGHCPTRPRSWRSGNVSLCPPTTLSPRSPHATSPSRDKHPLDSPLCSRPSGRQRPRRLLRRRLGKLLRQRRPPRSRRSPPTRRPLSHPRTLRPTLLQRQSLQLPLLRSFKTPPASLLKPRSLCLTPPAPLSRLGMKQLCPLLLMPDVTRARVTTRAGLFSTSRHTRARSGR